MADDDQVLSLEDDDNGMPVLLAVRAPGQVAAQRTSGAVVIRGARSGNSAADPASGRFASTKPATDQEGQVVRTAMKIPQGLTREQWDRRRDVVRELARKLDDLTDEGLTRFLKDHPSVSDVNKINIEKLREDVRAQQIDDAVDILDDKIHGRMGTAKLKAPNRFLKRVFDGLQDSEVLYLFKRLEGKGWDPEDLTKHVASLVRDEERRTKLEQLYGERKPKTGQRRR